jgi:hypothetical protein
MRANDLVLRLTIFTCIAAAGYSVSSVAGAACAAQNTCFGINALHAVTTGDFNSAFGYEALFSNTEGNSNSAVGAGALRSNTVGHDNTAVGFEALENNTTGGGNTAVGHGAGTAITTGSRNTAVGWFAYPNFGGPATGDQNTALGALTLSNFHSGSENTAVGSEAMLGPDDSEITSAVGNTAVGSRALERFNTGQDNTAVGRFALLGIDADGGSTISFNTGIGAGALQLIRNGQYNTAIGYQALLGHSPGVIGDSNTATGAFALMVNSSGAGNTAMGFNALHSTRTGFRNTANGINSLGNVTTGVRNTALGAGAGFNITTGSDNIIIGAQTHGVATQNGVIRIGNGTFQKRAFIAGISGVSTGLSAATAVFIDANGQLGTIKSSREVKEEIQPMGNISDRLLALRPVTFRYKDAYDDESKPTQFGLVAEEVAEVFPELVIYDANGEPETVAYHLLTTLLLNEFQKQAVRIAVLEKKSDELAQLKQEFAQMAEDIERLERAGMVAGTE